MSDTDKDTETTEEKIRQDTSYKDGAAGTAEPRSRKKKPFPFVPVISVAVILVILIAAGICAGLYIHEGQQYRTVFFPNTVINGHDVSYMTVDEVKDLIDSGITDYVLTIDEREDKDEEITGDEIDLHSVFDGSLEEHLAEQNPMDWWNHREEETSFHIPTMIAFDEEKLDKIIDNLQCLNPYYSKEPADAYLSDYQPGTGYYVVPETQGTMLDKDIVKMAVNEAVMTLQTEISLDDFDAYYRPKVTSDDPGLNALADELNRYVNVTVTYTFGDNSEVLSGDRINEWLTIGSDGTVTLDQDQVAEYVKELASTYNTIYQKKTLKTSYGPTVTINGGDYGWRIDQGEETSQLYNIIMSGESTTREPVYSQTANSHGENDYGNTYVEINLTAQHLYYYKDGSLVIQSDLVSGNTSRNMATPTGAYGVMYKERNATLKGEGYETPVDYWMPFNGGVGMHDASWRAAFGGTIYMTNGSHGCINLPPSVAKTIYENISVGCPVLVYQLSGTGESSTTSVQTEPETTAAQPVETEPAVQETEPETTAGYGPGYVEGSSSSSGDTGNYGPGYTSDPETSAADAGSVSISPATGEELGPGA